MAKRKELPDGSQDGKNKRRFECEHIDCEKACGNRYLLEEHYQKHTKYCVNKCDVCDKKRKSRFECKHAENDDCVDDYALMQGLNRHYQKVHTEYCILDCEVCDNKRARIGTEKRLIKLYKKKYDELYGDEVDKVDKVDEGDSDSDEDSDEDKYGICRHYNCSYGEIAILKSNLARHHSAKKFHNCNNRCIECQRIEVKSKLNH